jgi:hypothetical protein
MKMLKTAQYCLFRHGQSITLAYIDITKGLPEIREETRPEIRAKHEFLHQHTAPAYRAISVARHTGRKRIRQTMYV